VLGGMPLPRRGSQHRFHIVARAFWNIKAHKQLQDRRKGVGAGR
jgi:hypothetical protein